MMWIRLTCWGHYFDLTVWRVGLNGAAGTLELGQCEWWPMEGIASLRRAGKGHSTALDVRGKEPRDEPMVWTGVWTGLWWVMPVT